MSRPGDGPIDLAEEMGIAPRPSVGAPASLSSAISATDLARYAAAVAAADDPEELFGGAMQAFVHMYALVCAGDGLAARGAGLVVQDKSLQFCAAVALSARSAEEKCRFLKISIGWAWPRVPATAAVLEAGRGGRGDAVGLGHRRNGLSTAPPHGPSSQRRSADTSR